MGNFDYKKYLAEGRLYENILDVNVNEEEDEVEVTYKGESYKSALGDELLFIHYFKDDEYHSENDAPEIFKYLKGKGGELEVDDKEATLTIKMSDLDDEGRPLKENLDIEDVRLYIQKELGRAGEQDAGLDAYIDSIQRDFAAGRDAYDDYEMDDYLEDFENYIADKMDL